MSTSQESSRAPAIRAIDVIRKKRDGAELSRAEMEAFVRGYTVGEILDYQASAWLMAVLLRGMSRAETSALTDAMLHSGEVLDLSDLDAPKVDKHSTGGVGDKTSLVLAPLLAAGGLYVPMISGRGLGHTGGTLDKLESIPGFRVDLSLARFQEVLRACRCCMIGQTEQIAPADRKFYALRDVTGTVESPYLICASIMSKKMAEGIDGLVLDVKVGSGAFMKTEKDATFLAELLVETGRRMGKRAAALLTDMDQPLGACVGNSLEVIEALDVLKGTGPADVRQLCLELGAWMFHIGRPEVSIAEGKRRAEDLIRTGAALDVFRKMIELQGGDARVVDDVNRLPRATNTLEVKSTRAGCVTAIQSELIGTACVVLGGGREKREDDIDPAVGIVLRKKIGDRVQLGEPLCTIHYNSADHAARAKALLESSFCIAESVPAVQKLIRRVIRASPSPSS